MPTFEVFIAALAQTLGLDLGQKPESPVEITIDELPITITGEVVGTDQFFILHAPVGTVDAQNELPMYRMLLEANLLWSATANATIGVNSATREALICYRAPALGLDVDDFPDLVTAFYDVAANWRHILAQQAADAEAEDLPADSMAIFRL